MFLMFKNDVLCLCKMWLHVDKETPLPVFSFFTTVKALLCVPKNLIPWRDSNQGLLVPEADAMSTAPRRQGFESRVARWFVFKPKIQIWVNFGGP
jgi:hypothetical protein